MVAAAGVGLVSLAMGAGGGGKGGVDVVAARTLGFVLDSFLDRRESKLDFFFGDVPSSPMAGGGARSDDIGGPPLEVVARAAEDEVALLTFFLGVADETTAGGCSFPSSFDERLVTLSRFQSPPSPPPVDPAPPALASALSSASREAFLPLTLPRLSAGGVVEGAGAAVAAPDEDDGPLEDRANEDSREIDDTEAGGVVAVPFGLVEEEAEREGGAGFLAGAAPETVPFG